MFRLGGTFVIFWCVDSVQLLDGKRKKYCQHFQTFCVLLSVCSDSVPHYFFLFFKKDFIYLFLEKEKEGKREGEKHQCVVAAHTPLLGTWPVTQACVLTRNQTGDPLVHSPALNPLSHTSQGSFRLFPLPEF